MKFFKKNVLTYGTYDLLHEGHVRLFKRLKRRTLGGKLFVGVATDEWNKNKGKKSIQNQETRLKNTNESKYVDFAFYEEIKSMDDLLLVWKRDIEKFNIDVVYMGSDHKGNLDYLRKHGIKIKYLPRTKNISTTDLKKYLGKK